ncbi:hypothetical protein [Nocardia otitidiscaviarum]|uniref:hypothetical protein n=1 Tax=Nocardia otitidiscaviarum TaxID=1823 RepID=UPI0018942C0E|nr:hypothetical protein [Nocardia otitidiscaviarum]MBF6183368.1 hypothetical protein [Nocardia otitidiscaviarum]
MNSSERFYRRRDVRLPLTAVKERFEQIAMQQVPLSPQAAAALPESPVTWGRLRALLTDSSVPFTVMDVDAVWTWLISRARREGPDAVLACAGVAVPMMASAAARLARRVGGDRADAEAAVLTAFLEAVENINLGQARLWCALRWAAYRGGRRWEKREALSPVPIPPDNFVNRQDRDHTHPEHLLGQAVAEGVIDAASASLIADTRLAGRSLISLAAELDLPYKRLHRVRKRAETRVAVWLRERLAEAAAERTSVVEAAAVDAAAGSPGEQRSARPVAISRARAASDRCQGNTAISPYPVTEVKRCA